MDTPLQRFKAAILTVAKDSPSPVIEVVIAMHDNPDPDCIGAAVGLQKLLKAWFVDIPNKEVKCLFVHDGEISHNQNKTMINVLNISLIGIEKYEIASEDSTRLFVSVDCLPERCCLAGEEFLFSIDHHKTDTKKAKIKDIRQVGACSSIIFDYLQKEGIKFDKDNDEDRNVATALIMGIKTDTSDLASDNIDDLDFEAFKYLIGYVDQNKLSIIIRYPLPPYYFELRSKLDQEGNSMLENGIYIGGIGYIAPSKRDVLPTIADERSRVDGTNTSFIFAIVGTNIEVSVRSNGFSVDVNSLCQNIFGKEYGGGKMGAGAAKIPMGYLSVEEDSPELQEKMWLSIREKMFHNIMKEMSNHR